MTNILREWVTELPLREQGSLLTCIRGCDLVAKRPLDSMPRRLVAALRYNVLVPADEREVDSEPGSFMSRKIPGTSEFKPSDLDQYPMHWIAHIMHGMEVLAYRHPDTTISCAWYNLYAKMVHALHLNVETRQQMIDRLSEDRISSQNVVS